MLSKEEIFQIIQRIEDAGFFVVSVTSDMHQGNVGLAKKLGVTSEKPYFRNPAREDAVIYWFYDPVHLLKLVRNYLITTGFILESKTIVSLPMFKRLLEAKGKNEITIGYKLTEKHIDVRGQDKQRVRTACELLSTTTSNLIKTLFPKDSKMLELSKFILECDSWFDTFNSHTIHHNHKPLKEAFEVNYQV